MGHRIKIWVLVTSMIMGVETEVFASEPQGPPCAADTCATSCEQHAASYGLPEMQPNKPPENGLPRCLKVSVQEGGEDGCDFVEHTICDCDATAPQPGVIEAISGMPGFGMKADAPNGTCVRMGQLPASCLMRAEEVRCALDGDGSDCKTACDLLRTRIDAELPRSQTVTVDGAACADATACGCIVQFEGKCFSVGGEVACGSSPKAAYDNWLAAERAKEYPRCDAGCHCAMVSSSNTSWMIPISLLSLMSLALLRIRRRH